MPFYFVEWLTRLIAHYLSHWSFLEVLEYAGRFTVLIAVILYFMEAPDRRMQKHYQAWQVINSAAGKSGNGGRLEALQELNRDAISLVGVDVSKAFLQGIQLPGSDLHYAAMQNCDLRNANFRRANLAGADLGGSNLGGADLRNVAAAGADLFNTDLTAANLNGADLTRADLRKADLSDLRWDGISAIRLANIQGVEHAPEQFVRWAMNNGAVAIEDDKAWNAAKEKARGATNPSAGD
jgi:hypothetical protein